MCFKSLLLSSVAALFSLVSDAATWYLISTENSDGAAKGFDNPSAWSSDGNDTGTKATDFSLGDTYIVRKNAHRLRVLGVAGCGNRSFAGGILQVGHNNNHGALLLYAKDPARIFFPRISLQHGCIMAAGDGDFLLDSDIVVDTVETRYTHITFNAYADMLMRLEGRLSATEASTLVMGMTNAFMTTDSSIGTRLEIASDCSGFNGAFSVVSLKQDRLAIPDKSVLFGTTSFPGNMSFAQNCALGTLAVTNTLSVNRLSMGDNAFLSVPIDGNAAGKITVTETFAAAGSILILTSGTATPGARIPILEYPISAANDKVNFIVNDCVATVKKETANGVATVYLCYPRLAAVFQTSSTATLLTDEHWSDESTENAAGKNYVVDLQGLTVSASEAILKMPERDKVEFRGDSLTIGKDCSLYFFRQNGRIGFVCSELRMLDGSALRGDQKTYIDIDNGNSGAPGRFVVPSGVVKLGVSNGRDLTINHEIVGAATLKLTGLQGKCSAPDGSYCFYALNTNFFGRIVADLQDDRWVLQSGIHARHNFIKIKDYRNLGGDLPKLDPMALTLTKYDNLRVENNDVDIPKKSNRGIFANGNGIVHVGKGKRLRLNTQIAVNGAMYKTGEGVLELACPVRFGESGDSPSPGANDMFVITGGTVRVASSDAFDGLRVKFTDIGSLEVVLDMEDETMVRYGLCNVKTQVPFVLNDGESKMPFEMSVKGDAPALQSFTVGAVTVDASASDAVRAMLPVRAPKLFAKYLSEWAIVRDEENNTVTFAVKCYKKGMIFHIR